MIIIGALTIGVVAIGATRELPTIKQSRGLCRLVEILVTENQAVSMCGEEEQEIMKLIIQPGKESLWP